MSSVELHIEGGVARITLNRPEKRNALDRSTLEELTASLQRCGTDAAVRVVQITGAGKAFCAGADLEEMRAQIAAAPSENLAHAESLARMLAILHALPKPTIARVNGDGYGGALGVIGACDLVIVLDTAKFAFTEVRLGIIPAVISPYVVPKMGESAALRYFLSADPFSAAELKSLGLAHEVLSETQLDAASARFIESLLKGAPGAQSAAKTLIRDVLRGAGERQEVSLCMAARLAQLRVLPEAQEGFAAFFAKRKPNWRLDQE